MYTNYNQIYPLPPLIEEPARFEETDPDVRSPRSS